MAECAARVEKVIKRMMKNSLFENEFTKMTRNCNGKEL